MIKKAPRNAPDATAQRHDQKEQTEHTNGGENCTEDIFWTIGYTGRQPIFTQKYFINVKFPELTTVFILKRISLFIHMETVGGKEERCMKSTLKSSRENKLYVCTKSLTMRL